MHVLQHRSAHSGKIERWLGGEAERISSAMRGWYGRPILVANVPSVGGIRVGADGDFIGRIDGGDFMSLAERCVSRFDHAVGKLARRNRMHAGFSSLSDLITEATTGKRQTRTFQKVGTTGVVAATNTLWYVGNQPVAAGAPGNAPGGTTYGAGSAGSLWFTDPASGDTLHVVRLDFASTVAGNTLLLYDRLFGVNKTMNSTATEAVTGVPTRYQSSTKSDPDYIGDNFLMVETRAVLAATAHKWTTCTYTNQDGGSSTLPSLTGNSGSIVNRLDQPTGQWFAPLASGDTGIKALTQMQCSAAVATGSITFAIGHPLAFVPMPVANMMTIYDGINTAFNFARIFNDACLALLEITKPATSATTYNGFITAVSG